MATKNIVKELLPCHPDYDAAAIQKTQDFYEGGKAFNARKAKYLMPRRMDSDKHYLAARLAAAKYTREFGRCTDDLVGCILRDVPRITVNNQNDPRAAYWLGLNTNVDGYGHSLEWLMQNRLVQTMLHDRSYLTMDWPDVEPAASGILAHDKTPPPGGKRARLDVKICYQNAETADDWDVDDEGRLLMLRTKSMSYVRRGGVIDTERHKWTFTTLEQIISYVAEKPITQQNWSSQDVATSEEPIIHNLGYLPAWLIPAPEGMSFGNGLIDTYDALFNTEAAKAFLIAATALNVPWVSGKEIKTLKLSEHGFLNLGENGTFGWSAPPGDAFRALADECEDIRRRAESSIRAMADKALQTHQSAAALGVSKGPKAVLLAQYRNPAKQVFQTVLDEIAKLRQEMDLEPRIVGMDQLTEQTPQIETATAQILLGLPLPLTAKKNIIGQLVSTNCDLSIEEQEQADAELKAMDDEDFELEPEKPEGVGAQGEGEKEPEDGIKTPVVKEK